MPDPSPLRRGANLREGEWQYDRRRYFLSLAPGRPSPRRGAKTTAKLDLGHRVDRAASRALAVPANVLELNARSTLCHHDEVVASLVISRL